MHMDVVTVLVEAQQILIAQTPQLLEMVVCQEEEVAEGEVPLTLVALEQEAQEGTEEEAKLECGFINMSGLIQINQAGNSGIAGNPIDFQRFTTTGSNLTWTKPPHAKIVWIETIGAGGSGGTDAGSGGGGGGQGRFGGSAQGGQGGVWGSYTVGGNAATGTGDGADGVSRDFGCGNGGNGGGNDGYGGNGGIPGGGGGGGNATSGQGNGARGEVRIWAW